MENKANPTQPARRLATIPRTSRSELRLVLKELYGHSFVEIGVWENRRSRMVKVSSVTLRRGAEIEAALAALSDVYLLTTNKEAQ
jgi:hypothetical protein